MKREWLAGSTPLEPIHAGHGHAHGGPHGHAHGDASSMGFVAGTGSSERPELERGAGRGQVLFLDCPSGIAGDMTVAALLDLGVPVSVLREALDQLALPGVSIVHLFGHVGALGASRFEVHEALPSSERSYADVRRMLDASALLPAVIEMAQRIFLRLAEAEAEVHRQPLDEVTFHEVGAVDSIVDIVLAAAAVEYLGARVMGSPLPLGRGFVATRHGQLPLPAPATLVCLRGVPTRPSGLEAELVTPTGAAIVASLALEFTDWPSLRVDRVGCGAGTRVLPDRPNVLRAILGRPNDQIFDETSQALLEASIDDMTGERAAFALERLLADGALDAWFGPLTMKKGRPGLLFSVLCHVADAERLTARLFAETTTLGVRKTRVARAELPRRVEKFSSSFGPVRVKISGDEPQVRFKLEFEDCAEIARKSGRPLADVIAELEDEWRQGRASFLPSASQPSTPPSK